jgi:nitrite reductase/ring-hydroxylating ferredoxin subunit
MGKFLKVADIRDLSKNQMRVYNVKGQEILVMNIEDKLYAVNNQCPHLGYPLYLGRLEDHVLICGFHDAKFDVRTGKSVGPVTDKSLKTFHVRIHDSSIFIDV